MSSHSVVVLQGNPIGDEALASVAIKPGMLLEKNTDGTVKPHATAAATALDVLVATERTEIGDGITGTYAIGDTVKFVRPRPGDKLTMRLATGESCAIGGRLESNGDGALQAFTTGKAPFRAYEAFTTVAAETLVQVTVVDS